MANFTNINKEILSNIEKSIRQKVNTLGPDGYVSEEPFGKEYTFPSTQIMKTTPDSTVGLIAPNYDDYMNEEGAVGTRYGTDAVGTIDPVMLHSYLPSGKTGPESVQTFFTVTTSPGTHGIDSINTARMRPLISPAYSQGKTNAADTNAATRGFELALYPSRNNGGILEADTTNGPIPTTADPGASDGIGDDGFWYVDYDDGIVRFSCPPLNGSSGVMNPNNVFGDINGNTVTDGYGAITMFGVFYKYTGELGIPDNLSFTTVGDGYVSHGTYNGVGANVMQAAIDSLPDEGGTVFIKEGQYEYVSSVTIPTHVNVVGVGGVSIRRPTTEPAFIINDGYVVVEGLEIIPRHWSEAISSGACIELRTRYNNQVIQNITIKDNILYGEPDAPALAFAITNNGCTHTNVKIVGNTFKKENSVSWPVYIGERLWAGISEYTIVTNLQILENVFADTSLAINLINGSTRLVAPTIENNRLLNGRITISTGAAILYAKIIGNECAQVSISDAATYLSILGNTINGACWLAAVDKLIFSNNNVIGNLRPNSTIVNSAFSYNTMVDFIVGTSITSSSISDNIITGACDLVAVNYLKLLNNQISGNITATTLANSTFSSNTMLSDITTSGAILSLTMSNNQITGSITAGTTVADSIFSDNTIHAFTIQSTAVSTEICNNVMLGGITLTDAVTSLTMSNNRMPDSIVAGSTIMDSIFSGNKVGDQFVVTTSIASSTFSDNVIGSACSLAAISGLSFSNNRLSSTISATSVSDLIFCNNKVAADFSITTSITDAVISNNTFGDDINFDSPSATRLVMCDNDIIDNITFGTSGTSGEYLDFTFSGNHCDSFVCNSQITDGIISNNHTSGFQISISNPSTQQYCTYNTVLTGNHTNQIIIEQQGAAAVRYVGTDSVFDGNYLEGSLSFANTGAFYCLNRCSISGNVLNTGGLSMTDGGAAWSIQDSTINGNTATAGAIAISNMMRISFSDNIAYSFTSTNVGSCVLCENTILEDWHITQLTDSTLSNNRIVSDLDIGTTTSNTTISGNGIDGFCHLANTTSLNFLGNRVAGLVSTTNPINMMFSDNNIGGTFTVTTATRQSVLADNIFYGAVDVSAVSDSTLSGNYLHSSLFADSFTTSVFSNNLIAGACELEATTGLAFSDNQILGQVTAAIVSESTFSDNKLGMSFTADSISDSIFSGNIVTSTCALPSISGLTFSGNHIGNIHIPTNADYLVLSDNVIDGYLRISDNLGAAGSIDDSIVSGNIIVGEVTATSVVDSVFSNNNLSASFTATSFTTSTLSDGYILGNLNITSSSQISAISGNNIIGYCHLGECDLLRFFGNSVTGEVTTHSADDSVFSGNYMAASFTASLLASSTFSDNRLGVSFNAATVTSSILSGNIVANDLVITTNVRYTIISCNIVSDDFTISAVNTTELLICDNYLYDYVFLGTSGSTGTYESFVFSNNYCDDDVDIYSKITYGSICGNMCFSNFDITIIDSSNSDNCIEYSVISGNYFGGSVFSQHGINGARHVAANCAITGNFWYGGLTFSNDADLWSVDECSISGNTFYDRFYILAGASSTGSVQYSAITGNSFNYYLITLHDMIGVTFSSNNSLCPFEAQDATDCVFSDNTFYDNQDFQIDALSGSCISNNRFGGYIEFTSITDSVLDANIISELLTVETIATSILSNNRTTTYLQIETSLASSSLIGNEIGTYCQIGQANESIICQNNIGTYLSLTSATTTTIDNSIIDGNIIHTTATITNTYAGAIDSSDNGQIISGSHISNNILGAHYESTTPDHRPAVISLLAPGVTNAAGYYLIKSSSITDNKIFGSLRVLEGIAHSSISSLDFKILNNSVDTMSIDGYSEQIIVDSNNMMGALELTRISNSGVSNNTANTVHTCASMSSISNNTILSFSIISVAVCNMIGNTFHDVVTFGPDDDLGISGSTVANNIFLKNVIIYLPGMPGGDGVLSYSVISGNFFQRQLQIYGSGIGGDPAELIIGSTISNNIFVGDFVIGTAALHEDWNITDTTISGNVCYADIDIALHLPANVVGLLVFGNTAHEFSFESTDGTNIGIPSAEVQIFGNRFTLAGDIGLTSTRPMLGYGIADAGVVAGDTIFGSNRR